MTDEIASLRIRDVELFVEVAKAKSIREVARRLRTTSGQVSKAVQNLEKRLGSKLFRRSVAGVLLTSQGSELMELAEKMLSSVEEIEGLFNPTSRTKSQRLAIASTSFINTNLTIPVVCKLNRRGVGSGNFRFLDLAPNQMVSVGLRGGFDLAVHIGSLSWPATWTSQLQGALRWVLCARQDHPLGQRLTLKQILEYPFVMPTYWTSEGLVRGNDQFPIAKSKRRVGHETATADAAVPILLNSDQLAFLPELLVNPWLKNGKMRELKSNEIPVVEKDIYLSVKSDVVPAHLLNGLSEAIGQVLGKS